ncbi:hypothetical protein ACQP2E_22095 [Actinoplanes sp. CA-015351]|uniref:hypothetical protein n=1 Tax=Actinoplanes sp. CA-015351 TaxID=3239897 RepID=UPI003D993259
MPSRDDDLAVHLPHGEDVYRDLHTHPELAHPEIAHFELGFAEHRTAATIAATIAAELTTVGGWEITERAGVTGEVAVPHDGAGRGIRNPLAVVAS